MKIRFGFLALSLCVCMCVCVHASLCVCVCVCAHARAHVCVCDCLAEDGRSAKVVLVNYCEYRLAWEVEAWTVHADWDMKAWGPLSSDNLVYAVSVLLKKCRKKIHQFSLMGEFIIRYVEK